MFASLPAIIEIGLSVITGAQQAIKLGKDVAPYAELLKDLFGGKKITAEELDAIRTRNDALNAAIEALPEED
jgi:hypothetical protein